MMGFGQMLSMQSCHVELKCTYEVSMEANKERQEEKKVEEKNKKKKEDADPMGKAREVIRETICNKSGTTANDPDDILAFSRSVQNVDSSLE
ncbi:hypothetical protein L2E82_16367 [Cichorium intybus]|uniref:Uncharacterized protein n=1 Tax=Cichorium intybus TaxID=13427 RepID=A0ACB9F4P7_CICIN|nr:hypothetical protein L2E82_16367 [Cichorium intybus]